VKLRAATAADAEALARVHGEAFAAAWSAHEIAALMAAPGGYALVVDVIDPVGFILCRAVAGEAEILTLAVRPAARRRGVGRALLEAALGAARAAGAA